MARLGAPRRFGQATAALFALLVAVLFAHAGMARAGDGAKPDPARGRARIITPAELSRSLAGVIVIDARASGYLEGHVPGGLPMHWQDWTLEKPNFVHALFGDPAKWGQTPRNDSKLQERLRTFGLSNSKTVVVVGSPRGWGEEGRIAWNLLYWGAQDVALLDGGFPAWVQAGMPIEKGESKVKVPAGDFTLSPDDTRRIALDRLIDVVKAGSRLILDARTNEEYDGKRMPGQKRGGHIPKSRLVPEASLYQADGRYIDSAGLAAVTRIERNQSPVAYCTGGVRSALLAVLLEARLGVRTANYDGSIWEWAAHRDLPMAPPLTAGRSTASPRN